jgi:SAM-dependent methyltransferase
VDTEVVAWLCSAEGDAALAAAADLVGRGDPLAATTALRATGLDPDRAAAALTQATLRRQAEAKFGPDAHRMLFTRAGLEQATRAVVATRRAQRLVAAGATRVADLGCGIGSDARAFARAGLRVLAVEADPTTAAIAAANLVGTDAVVEYHDATTVDLSDVDAAFCDPARRDAARGRRVFDPEAFSPPWSFVTALADTVARTVLKVAPGLDHALIPPGAEAEWVSVGGDVVEAALWCGPLAEHPRRATVLRGDGSAVLTGSGTVQAPVGPLGRYLYDPDGAVVRSHLVAEFAATIDGTLADRRIAYVFTDEPVATPFGSGFEIVDRLPYGVKPLRAELRRRGIGRLEIRKRGVAVEPDRLRRELRLDGPDEAVLVLTRIDDDPIALLAVKAR